MRLAESDMITNLPSTELAQAELGMLEMIAPVALEHRVEFAAKLSLRQSVHGPVGVGGGERHKIWLDSIGDGCALGTFRYELERADWLPRFSVATHYHDGRDSDTNVRSVEELLMADAEDRPVHTTKTTYKEGGIGVEVNGVEDLAADDIFAMLQKTIDVAANTSRWPILRDGENPVLGRSYGNYKPMIDVSEVMPLYAQLVGHGVDAMRAAGEDTAADFTADFDVGKRLNYAHTPSMISLWSRNSRTAALFDCSVTALGEHAFISVDLEVTDYEPGNPTTTKRHLWQHGDSLQVRTENQDEPRRLVGFEAIAQLASVVAQVAKKEEVELFQD